jgi:hypothetical protein
MPDCEITCATKPPRHGEHEHITHVGNPAADWVLPVELVIKRIDEKTDTFFVLDPKTNKRSNVAVVREPNLRPYLRAHADGAWNDQLLSLNDCPRK